MRPLTGRELFKEAPPRWDRAPPGTPTIEAPPAQDCLESCGVGARDAPAVKECAPPQPLYAGAPLTDISRRSERVLGKRASGSCPGTMA